MANEKETLPGGISPSLSLVGYNEEIKQGLQNVIIFTQWVDQLLLTQSPTELLQAANTLFTFKLDTKMVTFPHQYNMSDWYLLFMTRLLEIHNIDKFSLASAQDHEELGLFLEGADTMVRFQFTIVNDGNGGAFFTEVDSGNRLFYLNLERKQLFFNSRDITNLFIVKLRKQASAAKLMTAVHTLMEFAQFLEADFGFMVDYNILEITNGYHYEVTAPELSAGVLDKLFVLSAESDYIMQNATTGIGAHMALHEGTKIDIMQTHAATGRDEWHLEVTDDRSVLSWLDILMDYDFIRAWYLRDREQLEIMSNPLIFGMNNLNNQTVEDDFEDIATVETTEPSSNEVKVEVLQPTAGSVDNA